MRLPAELFIAFVIVFGAVEITRWRRPDFGDVLTKIQKIRRVIALVLLLTLGVMLLGGTMMPAPVLVPPVMRYLELLYWLFFCLLTVFVPLIAFFEFKDSIRRGSQLRREVYRSIVTTPLDQLPNDNDPPKKPEV